MAPKKPTAVKKAKDEKREIKRVGARKVLPDASLSNLKTIGTGIAIAAGVAFVSQFASDLSGYGSVRDFTSDIIGKSKRSASFVAGKVKKSGRNIFNKYLGGDALRYDSRQRGADTLANIANRGKRMKEKEEAKQAKEQVIAKEKLDKQRAALTKVALIKSSKRVSPLVNAFKAFRRNTTVARQAEKKRVEATTRAQIEYKKFIRDEEIRAQFGNRSKLSKKELEQFATSQTGSGFGTTIKVPEQQARTPQEEQLRRKNIELNDKLIGFRNNREGNLKSSIFKTLRKTANVFRSNRRAHFDLAKDKIAKQLLFSTTTNVRGSLPALPTSVPKTPNELHQDAVRKQRFASARDAIRRANLYAGASQSTTALPALPTSVPKTPNELQQDADRKQRFAAARDVIRRANLHVDASKRIALNKLVQMKQNALQNIALSRFKELANRVDVVSKKEIKRDTADLTVRANEEALNEKGKAFWKQAWFNANHPDFAKEIKNNAMSVDIDRGKEVTLEEKRNASLANAREISMKESKVVPNNKSKTSKIVKKTKKAKKKAIKLKSGRIIKVKKLKKEVFKFDRGGKRKFNFASNQTFTDAEKEFFRKRKVIKSNKKS